MTSIANEGQLVAAGPSTTTARCTGLLVLRVMVGVVLLVHGVPKLGNPGGFVKSVAGLGVPLPEVAGILQIAGEVGLGVALLIGLFSRVAGVLVAVMMGLTWVVVHAPQGLLAKTGLSGESALLLGLAGVAIALLGGGSYSVDRLLAKVRQAA
jgi:putative oxidoreductase